MDTPQIPLAGLSRRLLLKGVAWVGGAATLLAVTVNRAAAKMAKSAVKYQDSPKGTQQCSNCAPFEPPTGCKVVEGPVSANGWCNVWQRKG